ncbi:PREDICTED: fatty acyl-CoA reductase 3-like [Ipomoea nil]|uniref:fatty acyl-CoA reductase 3-like n=1 Tax=Ipomoea nil TaxID=35883 RepID=UPI000901A95B|nr:PREDICTED: fatty acyl-CoA reductase 3-like [Ipomoea nil]
MDFFLGKTILITGATGFLAKVLVEKILRTQPNIKKIFLLIRAKDSDSARQRFNNEVLETELFRVLKEKVGGSLRLSALAEEKVFPVPGDISSDELGIVNSHLKDQVLREVDIIINSAATTTFDERYDVAMSINTFGAFNVLKFAKKCSKVKMLVHVSTAYVCGHGSGILPERPLYLGETLNGNSYLDIEVEKKVIEEQLKELEAQKATEKEVRLAMKELGIQRAKVHGWPNTYSFTKAMGEMLLLASKESLHLIILRPTIITSTYKEPFPGWIEGARTIDIFVLMYGKGKVNIVMGDPNTILDAIPGDMVVNSILAALVHHAAITHPPPQEFIYHVGSSFTNPLKANDIQKLFFRYFTDNPWSTKTGQIVKVQKPVFLTTMKGLRTYIAIHYLPILKVLKLLNMVLFNYFEEKCMSVEKNINLVIRLAELYKPYLFFYGSFDDTNTERLRRATTKMNLSETLFFDPNCIKWEDYFMKTHIPGVVKYSF